MSKFLPVILILVFVIPSSLQAEVTGAALVKGARKQIGITVGYDPSYQPLEYPAGDVPFETGVCTDVIIRAYRKVGLDLQKLLHEDISAAFSAYPSQRVWGLLRPDTNIDHRRVPNLQTFFSRKGLSFPVTDYLVKARPGDILTWQLASGVPHIGIVTDKRSDDGKRPLIIHNIGRGTLEEDVAAAYKITGWYRYLPEQADEVP